MKTVTEATTRFQMAPGDKTVGSRPAWRGERVEAENVEARFLCVRITGNPAAAAHPAFRPGGGWVGP